MRGPTLGSSGNITEDRTFLALGLFALIAALLFVLTGCAGTRPTTRTETAGQRAVNILFLATVLC